jgi:hypothetical protein
MKNRIQKISLVISTLFIFYSFSYADEQWPKMIQTADTNIEIYQPQLEKFNDNKLTARSVLSVTSASAPEPVFGVLCFRSTVDTDSDNRTVTLSDINVNRVLFPDSLEEQKDKLTAVIKSEMPKWTLQMSLDEMLTSLELVEKEKKAGDELNNTPPKIIFSEVPAVLVSFDGEPKLTMVENTHLMKAVNTPFFVVLDTKSKSYFLKAGDRWMKADQIKGPWQPAASVPAVVISLAEGGNVSSAKGTVSVKQAEGTENLLQIIVANEPTELIVTDGEPQFQTILGTDLLFISNTDSDVFMDIDNQQLYALLSGRWFTAPKKEGPWSYVYPDKLPADFAKIPPDSEKGSVRAHIAGTEEAREAVAETLIPQTAAVKRSDANLTVNYDGSPQFEPITGTSMQYAVNTPYSIILVNDRYYCCHDAVWFLADSPLGPWSVCTDVPRVIYTIPPSCPLYPVKYVYVYDSTPDIVYVGYTSGYLNCYRYHGCVVYGTGFYYTPWYGTYSYFWPWTWGFGFYYDDVLNCWGFGFSRRHGWFRDRFLTGGWWGHCVFDFDNFDIRHHFGERRFGSFSRLDRDRFVGRNNIFSFHRDSFIRASERPRTALRVENRRNNIFSDVQGRIFRNSINGWERHGRNGWSRIGTENRPQVTKGQPREMQTENARPGGEIEVPQIRREQMPERHEQIERHEQPSDGFESDRRELNREFMARNRAVERENNFQQYRNAASSRGADETRSEDGGRGDGFGERGGRDGGGGGRGGGHGSGGHGGGRGR